jgi:hypothetical protein
MAGPKILASQPAGPGRYSGGRGLLSPGLHGCLYCGRGCLRGHLCGGCGDRTARFPSAAAGFSHRGHPDIRDLFIAYSICSSMRLSGDDLYRASRATVHRVTGASCPGFLPSTLESWRSGGRQIPPWHRPLRMPPLLPSTGMGSRSGSVLG